MTLSGLWGNRCIIYDSTLDMLINNMCYFQLSLIWLLSNDFYGSMVKDDRNCNPTQLEDIRFSYFKLISCTIYSLNVLFINSLEKLLSSCDCKVDFRIVEVHPVKFQMKLLYASLYCNSLINCVTVASCTIIEILQMLKSWFNSMLPLISRSSRCRELEDGPSPFFLICRWMWAD